MNYRILFHFKRGTTVDDLAIDATNDDVRAATERAEFQTRLGTNAGVTNGTRQGIDIFNTAIHGATYHTVYNALREDVKI